ncbi:MAG: proprotein convertase P-domain-containing protein [Bacteroidetes bacterium]|nr:proprotein convertase P-domain-containing protein [Bacteroidota bacterium]
MKVVRLFAALVALVFLSSLTAEAQLPREFEYFRSPNAPIADFSTTSSSIEVMDVFKISTLSVLVDIDHPAAADLTITLTGPTGSYTLSMANGSAGANYENTIFDSNPGTSIPGVAINDPGNLTAYFRGVYIPESTLPTSGNGAGLWTLEVTDNLPGDGGTLVRWGLIFNRYDTYRDIRFGIDLNYAGYTTLNPLGLVEDITTYPPYTVQGYRPLDNTVEAYGYVQNSQTPGVLNLKVHHKYPNNSSMLIGDVEGSLPWEDAYIAGLGFDLESQTGTHVATADLFMRGDLYMSRPDNTIDVPLHVTPGSLAYDNGVAQQLLNPALDECDANIYIIDVPQTITSVDIWQGSTVELGPQPSMAAMSINVWDEATNTIVATTGPVPFPPQGEKWVTYPFSPPVTLPAGSYRVGYCLTMDDQQQGPNYGPGIGMDQAGSPFEPLGFLGRYHGFGLEQFSFDGGMSWWDEWFRTYTTKMIRPNFIQLSDVGVFAIYPVNGFSGLEVTVDFAAYAHYSYLPNQITFGKVWVIDNATNNVVGYQEKRVYLNQSPYMDTQVYNFPSLSSGNYTIRVVIERPDDENLINNEYSRQLVVPFAPMAVISDGPVNAELKDQIITAYAQQGVNVEFVDRSFGTVTFPENGKVLWIGDLSKAEALAAREYVQSGGSFAMLPEEKTGMHMLTDVFSQVANVKELNMMDRALTKPVVNDIQVPALSPHVAMMAENPNAAAFSLGKSDRANNRVASFFQRIKNADTAPMNVRDPRSTVVVTRSENISVVAERIGNLSVVNLFVKDSRPAERRYEEISNPHNFEITQNYPNPFNPTTNIAFNVPADANVSIRVYDMLGREVATLVNGFQSAGNYITTWDATNNYGQIVSSGVYIYRMEASPVDGSAPFAAVKKMVLSR